MKLLKRLIATGMLLAPITALPQTHNHQAPPVVSGERVSDERAWLMQLIASTSSEQDDERTREHALIHRQALGLEGLSIALTGYRQRFDHLTADYNHDVAGIEVASTAELVETHEQLNRNLAELLAEMVSYIQRNLTDEEWQTTSARLQESKQRIAGTDESASLPELVPMAWHFRLADLLDFNQNSAAGYSQYTALDTDGTYSYQTLYVYGSTNQQWSCTWTQVGQYNWAWEPPGCPASHNVKITNQVDGQGPVDLDEGTYSPATYISISHTMRTPFDTNQHRIRNGGKIICSVALGFFTFVFDYLTRFGQSNFTWNGQGTLIDCGVNPTCTNGRPWLVDGSYVYVGPRSCYPYNWTCFGSCTYNPITFEWYCTPHNSRLEVCRPLAAPRWAPCTPYP